MKNFKLIDPRIDIVELRTQLAQHPELWDVNLERKASVHAAMSDIWVRYRPKAEMKEPRHYIEPHWGEFYPAWYELPALHGIVYGLMAKVRAVHLGAVLITRIPPGGEILPHDDRGSWHAEFHNCKIYLPIQANPDCVNICGGESLVMKEGEAWRFDNLVVHSVENCGETDRMTLIVCMRTEP